MRVLIAGIAGRLGTALSESLRAAGHDVSGFDAAQVDVADYAATREAVVDALPDAVVHTAAWTDVDACALDPERAVRVNGMGAQNVAVAAAEAGASIAYVSTNEVFDGRLDRPYYEYDRPTPPNAYGYSKWIGEQATVAVNPRHYVVRTAWLISHGGRNFAQAILNAARSGSRLRVVVNEVANPTYTNDLADAIARLIEIPRYGTYHLTNEGFCSRYDLARYILDQADLGSTAVEKITSFEWARPSTPPPFSPLANLAGAAVGIRLRPWRDAVDAFLQAERLNAP